MKPMMMLGLVLIVLGVIGLIFQGVTYTTHEQVAKVGGVEVTAEKQKTVPIPLIGGVICLVAGVALVIAGSRH